MTLEEFNDGKKMGGDGFTPGTQRFAFGLFAVCCLLLAPKIMNIFADPEPEAPRVPFNGEAQIFAVESSVCGPDVTMSDKDLVASIHPRHWKHPNPLKDLNCGRSIKITELESSKEKSVVAKLYTKCIKGCKFADVALSSGAFAKLSKDKDKATLKVTWDFTD